MGQTIELTTHTTILCGDELGKYPWGNPLLVEGTSGRLQIDSALSVPLPDVDIVLLSHFHEDHTCGLGAHPDLDVRIHADDLDAVRDLDGFFAAAGFEGEDTRTDLIGKFGLGPLPQAQAFDLRPIDLGGVTVTPVHLPGHTAGHCGFLIEPDGVFFTADIDLSSFGPFYGDACASLSDMRTSLAFAADVKAAAYATYHHKREVRDQDEYRDMIAAFTAVIEQREDRVLSLLDKPSTLDDLVGKGVVYRPGRQPTYAAATERRMAQLHVEELIARGAVTEQDGLLRRN